jgi:hypothetical protein
MSEDPNRAECDERLQALEADVKDLALLFKHLVDSSPHGEQLLFASLGRIEEQDEAVLKFNDTLRELASEGSEEFLDIRGASHENFAPAKPPPRRLVTGDLPHKSKSCE